MGICGVLRLTKVGYKYVFSKSKAKNLNVLKSVEMQNIKDIRGNLLVCEISEQIEFTAKRFYVISEVPADVSRGNHGHKTLEQIIICLEGSFELYVHDGIKFDILTLNKKSSAYYVPAGCWRELRAFKSSSICLVLASEAFDNNDYINTFEEFIEWKNSV